MAVTFRKIATGEFDVFYNGEPTKYSIVNGSKGVSGQTYNMYGIVRTDGATRWIGSLQAAKKIVTHWLNKESKLKNGLLDWFTTSEIRSVKKRTTKSSTGGMSYKGYKIWQTAEGEFEVPQLEKGTLFDTVGDAKKFIGYWVKQGEKNPGMAKKKKGQWFLVRHTDGTYEVSSSPIPDTYIIRRFTTYKAAEKMWDRFSKTKNPSAVSSSEGWIPAHAVRMLPSGDIQLLTERGTMSNPGKRKSFLKKVGKVFGKVVKTAKGVIGNPRQLKWKPYFSIQGNYGYGWEEVTAEDTFKEARARIKEYRENQPGAYRIIKKKERIEGT